MRDITCGYLCKQNHSLSQLIHFFPKLFHLNSPSQKKPTIGPKSTARVITSSECRQEINVKERKKLEALKLKEERKAERERKKEEKRKMLEEKQKLKQKKVLGRDEAKGIN